MRGLNEEPADEDDEYEDDDEDGEYEDDDGEDEAEDSGEAPEWDDRKLCPDGACVGVIGANGTCNVCGRSAA
jgi:hypothetical protein